MSPLLQRLTGATALAGLLTLSVVFAAPPVQSVPKVDLVRYAGTWFELSRLPNRFQDKCAGDVTATYTPNPDGSVAVLNRCRMNNGETTRSAGVATAADGDTTGARLKVSFLPSWLQWFPLGRGDYWVVKLDPEYRYAVVSEPSREYMWVLSRTPQMEPAAYDALVEELRVGGYPVERLVRTPHATVPATPPAASAWLQRLVWAGNLPRRQHVAAL